MEILRDQAADKVGPRTGRIWVVTIPASSTPYDILGDGTPGSGLLPHARGRVVAIITDTEVGYRWADSDSEVINVAMTSDGSNPEQVCFVLPAGGMDEHVPTGRYLLLDGTGGTFRMAITSNVTREKAQSASQ